MREPLVRQAPRTITIAGNRVTWPAKSPPVKRPPFSLEKCFRHSDDSGGGDSNDDLAEGTILLQPPSPTRKKFPKKKVQTMGKITAMFNASHKERKDKEAKQKRVRQEALHRKITVEPLPQEVCEHELYTTWVSPVMRRVATEEDPLMVLRKTRAESRQCKMQVQPFSSMPSLRPGSKDEGVSVVTSRPGSRSGTAPRCSSRGGQGTERVPSRGGQVGMLDDPGQVAGATLSSSANAPRGSSRGMSTRSMKAASWGPVIAMLEQDTMGSFGGANAKFKSTGGAEANMLTQMRYAVLAHPQGPETRAVGGSREIVLPGQTLPRVSSAGGSAAPGGHPVAQLLLEPPSSLSHRIVVHRLEAQGKAFRETTFAEYMKENDIFTGEPKVRFDERRLHTEEEAVLQKANLLVGGPAKRQLRMQLRDKPSR